MILQRIGIAMISDMMIYFFVVGNGSVFKLLTFRFSDLKKR